VRREHLDRDDAVEPLIARAIHLSHTAGAERRQDFVWAESRSSCQRHEVLAYESEAMVADYTRPGTARGLTAVAH
jgi:hypothetical protein